MGRRDERSLYSREMSKSFDPPRCIANTASICRVRANNRRQNTGTTLVSRLGFFNLSDDVARTTNQTQNLLGISRRHKQRLLRMRDGASFDDPDPHPFSELP